MAIIRAYKQLGDSQGYSFDLSKYNKIVSVRLLLDYAPTDTDPSLAFCQLLEAAVNGDGGSIVYSRGEYITMHNPIKEYYFRFNKERLSSISIETQTCVGFLNV